MWSYEIADDLTFTIKWNQNPTMTFHSKPTACPWVNVQRALAHLYEFASNNMAYMGGPDEIAALALMAEKASAELVAKCQTKD